MTYILEHANVYKDKDVMKRSILIKNNKIDYINTNLNRLRFMRTDLSNYLLTPGHIMMNFSFSSNMPFQKFKDHIKENYINKGCTTIIVICTIKTEREIEDKIKKTRSYLLNSPIDFYIGLKIPLKILTPSLIRTCKRLHIPLVMTEIVSEKDMHQVPWGWIKEALFPYFFPIIPMWKIEESRFRRKTHLHLWSKIITEHGIPSYDAPMVEHQPLSMDILKKIGIYPAKGEIRVRGDVDYNLYDLSDLSDSVDEKPILDYDNHIPSYTVHKGKLMKIPSKIFYYPGFGKECKVTLPGHFVTNG